MTTCERCGSDHINHKPKSNPSTTPLTFVIFALLTYIAIKVLAAITGAGLVGAYFLLFVGAIVFVPVLGLVAVIIASALTGAGKTHTATCHACGMSWDEKGAVPPKRAAPSSQSR